MQVSDAYRTSQMSQDTRGSIANNDVQGLIDRAAGGDVSAGTAAGGAYGMSQVTQ